MRAINSTKSFKISDVFLRSQYRREMVRLYDKVISTLQPPDTYYLILFIFKVDVFFLLVPHPDLAEICTRHER